MRVFWLTFAAFLTINTMAIDITGVWSGVEYFDNGREPIPWRVDLRSTSPNEASGTNVGQRSTNPHYHSLFIDMKGEVSGDVVTFRKKYDGERGIFGSNNFVKGTISKDGNIISGTWIITDKFGRRTGTFSWKKVKSTKEAEELRSREITSEIPEVEVPDGGRDSNIITELDFSKKENPVATVIPKIAEPIRAPSSEEKKPPNFPPPPPSSNIYQSQLKESGEFWQK